MRIRLGGQLLHLHPPTVQWTVKLLFLGVIFVLLVYSLSRVHDDDDDDDTLRHHDVKPRDGELGIKFVEEDAQVKGHEGVIVQEQQQQQQKQQQQQQQQTLKYYPSAMEAGNVRRKLLMQVQRDILKSQVRPPDDSYNINVTLSDSLSMDREIPDTRPPICQSFTYDVESLPKATVVIPFYNEALSMVLRTVHSILSRSPDILLEGVILIDDASTRDYLKEPLDRYFNLLPKVQIVRNEKREGLIRARMKGYRMAKSDVVIFQDAHTECNVGWLEPLMEDLQRHPHSVIQPFVDGVDRLTMDFTAPPTYYRGAFSWDLRYTWLKLPDHEYIRSTETGQPFFTPTLVGCAMAVRKDYFDHIGWFDEGLNVWGGENIELGFRTWMCGGRVVSVTCSRVGHVFKEFPYTFDGNKEEIVQKNLIRVAEAWMDGWKKYFYATTRIYDFKRHELNEDEKKSLAERIQQRKDMKCKSFEWFMYNIMPEMDIPPMNAELFGEITNSRSSACWEVADDFKVVMTYFCFFHKIIPSNNFALTTDGLLRYREKCVMIDPPNPMLYVGECPSTQDEIDRKGIWELRKQGPVWGQIAVKRKLPDGHWERFCITQVTNVLAAHAREQMPQIGGECDTSNQFQAWSWTYGLAWDQVPKSALTEYRT